MLLIKLNHLLTKIVLNLKIFFKSDHAFFGVSENSFEQTQLDYESFNLDEKSSPPSSSQNSGKQAASSVIVSKQSSSKSNQTFETFRNSMASNFNLKNKRKTSNPKKGSAADDFVLV